MDIKQYYDLLELKPGASLDDVRQAYRDIVDVWHPDRFNHNQRLRKKAEEKFKEMNRAYEILISHLSSANGKSEKEQLSKRVDESNHKTGEVQKIPSMEEFAEVSTFLILKTWSHLIGAVVRFTKKQIEESGHERLK